MSERMTSVRLRDNPAAFGGGWAEWGRKSRAEMVQIYRERAQRSLETAQAILDADDSDFIVETYLGPRAERNKEEVHD